MATTATVPPVYASAAQLSQFSGPFTSQRYAIVEGIGLFRWYPNDVTTADSATVIAPSGGAIGRWKLSSAFPGASSFQRVDVVATSALDLSGLETVDDVSGADGLVVLATAQGDSTQNVPWVMSSGAWTRPTWFDTSAEALPGMVVSAQRGTRWGGSLWRMASPSSGSVTLGTTEIGWERVTDATLLATTSSAVSLADSTETLTLSAGRRRSAAISLLTAERTKTLSTAGATLGDLWTFERTDRSHHRLAFVNGGAGAGTYWANKPGTYSFRFDGTNWRPEWLESDPSLVFRPEDFGAKADGSTDDTAALQAMFDAAGANAVGASRSLNRRIILTGPYLITSTLRLVGNDGYATVIEGAVGLSGNITGTTITRAGSVCPAFLGGVSVTVSAAGKTLTRASGSWVTDGFAIGDYVMVKSALNTRQCKVTNVTALVLTVQAADTLTNETTSTIEVVRMDAVLRLVGCHRTYIRDLEIDCAQKTLFGIHVWIDQDSVDQANSSGVLIERVSIIEPRKDAQDAACIAFGARARSPAVGSQCDTIRISRCQLYGDRALAIGATEACGWKTLDQNNTRDFEIHDTGIHAFRRGIDWELSSGSLLCVNVGCESCEVGIIGNGFLTLVLPRFERVTKFVEGTSTAASLIVDNPIMNGSTDGTWVCLEWLGQIAWRGGYVRNYRCARTVSSINTGTNTITYADTAESAGQLAVGDRVVVRSTGTMPGGLLKERVYKVLAAGGSLGAWTATIEDYLVAPGVAVDITSAGTGAITLESIPYVRIGDHGAAFAGASFDGVHFSCAHDTAPVTDSGYTTDDMLLSPRIISSTGDPARVSARRCYGGVGLAPEILREVEGTYPQVAPLQPYAALFFNQVTHRFGGAVTRGTACVELNAAQLAQALPAGATATEYITIPARTRLVGVVVETDVAWAGSGITDAKLNIADFNGGAPAAGDIIANHDVDATGVRGFADADLGARLNRANAVQGGWMPSAGWSANWLIVVTLALTGATFSAASAGRTRIYLTLEKYPDPAKT